MFTVEFPTHDAIVAHVNNAPAGLKVCPVCDTIHSEYQKFLCKECNTIWPESKNNEPGPLDLKFIEYVECVNAARYKYWVKSYCAICEQSHDQVDDYLCCDCRANLVSS